MRHQWTHETRPTAWSCFPLLKTSGPARLGSLEFRSTEDLNGLTEDQAASVTEITRMLFALGDQRIKRASYAIVDRVELRNAPMELDAPR